MDAPSAVMRPLTLVATLPTVVDKAVNVAEVDVTAAPNAVEIDAATGIIRRVTALAIKVAAAPILVAAVVPTPAKLVASDATDAAILAISVLALLTTRIVRLMGLTPPEPPDPDPLENIVFLLF